MPLFEKIYAALERYSNGRIELVLFPALCFLLPISVVFWKTIRAVRRRRRIFAKYGHTDTAHDIIRRMIWKGQTAEQLVDSLGDPIAVDSKLLQTKSREIWKYGRRGRNQFGTKITIDDGTVVGWDLKRNG